MSRKETGLVQDIKTARADELLAVENVTKVFRGTGRLRSRDNDVVALDDISFELGRGETLALVGESGSGKTTATRCILRLIEPTSGEIRFEGKSILGLAPSQLFNLRRRMQVVFQDPFASLDPRMTIEKIVEEPLVVHRLGNASERHDRVKEILELVGIPAQHANRKPQAFSGGQRQRIAIARALVLNPELVVLDEPVTALDMSIQAQVLNLLVDLQVRLGLTYLLVVHDLSVAEFAAHRIVVMYRGKLVEVGTTSRILNRPLHPYTVVLLSAVPIADPELAARSHRILLNADSFDGAGVARGCPFRLRCPIGRERSTCQERQPELAILEEGHSVACHFPGELSLRAGEEVVVGATLDPNPAHGTSLSQRGAGTDA
jgi:oligopeptide transport system ATP-binding protein